MAIAYDAGSTGFTGAGTSFTFSHTCTGSGLRLMVGVTANKTTDIVTGVTYNGVALTRVAAVQAATTNFWCYVYTLYAPATGAHDVGVNFTGTEAVFATADSYTGFTGGLIDSSATGTDGAGDFAATTTVAGTGCWLYAFARSNDGDGIAAGASTTLRGSLGSGTVVSADSAATVGTGAQSLNFASSPGGETGWVAVSLAVSTLFAADAGAFTLTGVAANLARTAYQIAADAGSFVLTGIAARLRLIGWVNRSRPTSTWTDVNRSDQA